MRDIKFRAWGPNTKFMWGWEQLIPCTVEGAFIFGEKILMQ